MEGRRSFIGVSLMRVSLRNNSYTYVSLMGATTDYYTGVVEVSLI